MNLALLYSKTHKLKKAKELNHEIYELNKSNSNVCTNLGFIYAKEG